MELTTYYDLNWYDLSMEKIIKLGICENGKLIYDVGAGNSVLKDRIEATGAKWMGFDYEPRASFVQKWNVEHEEIEIENKPDCILFLEVLEHLFNPGNAIKNISSIAKKGTYLIMSTPNPYWSVSRIKFFFLGVFSNFTKEDMEGNHHVFTVWPHVLEMLLTENGFKIVDSYTLADKAKWPKFELHPKFIARIIFYWTRKIIEIYDKKTLGMSMGVVALKI